MINKIKLKSHKVPRNKFLIKLVLVNFRNEIKINYDNRKKQPQIINN